MNVRNENQNHLTMKNAKQQRGQHLRRNDWNIWNEDKKEIRKSFSWLFLFIDSFSYKN